MQPVSNSNEGLRVDDSTFEALVVGKHVPQEEPLASIAVTLRTAASQMTIANDAGDMSATAWVAPDRVVTRRPSSDQGEALVKLMNPPQWAAELAAIVGLGPRAAAFPDVTFVLKRTRFDRLTQSREMTVDGVRSVIEPHEGTPDAAIEALALGLRTLHESWRLEWGPTNGSTPESIQILDTRSAGYWAVSPLGSSSVIVRSARPRAVWRLLLAATAAASLGIDPQPGSR